MHQATQPQVNHQRGLGTRAAAAAGAEAAPARPAQPSSAATSPSSSPSTTLPPRRPRGAYIHLPFCVRKCLYCDFAVTALGARAAAAVAPLSPGALRGVTGSGRAGGGGQAASPPAAMASYLATLHAEIAATAGPSPGDLPLTTLSFGGGTPSLVPPADLARLVDAVDAKWGLAPGAEVSMEADPGTFDAARLRELKGRVARPLPRSRLPIPLPFSFSLTFRSSLHPFSFLFPLSQAPT